MRGYGLIDWVETMARYNSKQYINQFIYCRRCLHVSSQAASTHSEYTQLCGILIPGLLAAGCTLAGRLAAHCLPEPLAANAAVKGEQAHD